MSTAVIDTMVFAYALFNEPHYKEESLAVLELTQSIHVPDLFRAEFCNVAWQWLTHNQLSLEQAILATERAEALLSSVTSSETLWFKAIEMAVYTRHPAYDAFFVVLAERLSCPLVTYDKKLLLKFPGLATRPDDYLNDNK